MNRDLTLSQRLDNDGFLKLAYWLVFGPMYAALAFAAVAEVLS